MVTLTVIYYIAINLIAFILYGIDKRKAINDKWRISESALIIVAVLGGALGGLLGMLIFRHKTQKIKFKVVIPIFIAFHCVIFGFFAVTTIQIISFGNKYEDHKADVAIVLGAATTGKEIKPVFQERVNEAIRLYNAGKCEKIILTGGVPKGSDIADSQLALEYALGQGVPKEDILIERLSTTTEENLIYAKMLMAENSYRSAQIVSDPLHMLRSVMLAKDIGIEEVYSTPTQTSRYQSLESKLRLLNREESFYVAYILFKPAEQ